MRQFAALCVLGILCGGARGGEPLEVQAAYYRIKIPADPGSATVLVRNRGREPLTIDRLLMDGSPLPAEGIGHGLRGDPERKPSAAEQLAAARIVWARLTPNPIPPGRSSLLHVQFRTRPPYAFHLRLMAGKTAPAECRLFPIDTPVRVTNIAFPADLSECLIYVANTSKDKAERIQAVELNDVDVTARIWASSRELPPGGKALVVVPKPGLAVGDSATVVVALGSGLRIVGRVRALPVFPIALEHGEPDAKLGIPDRQDHWPVRTEGPGPAKPGGPPPRFASDAALVRVFHCPSHIMGSDWQGCAAEALRRVAVARELHPRLPAYDAVCRARSGLASACFAGTTDAGFLNPYLPQYSQANPKHPIDAVLRALEMARAANAPDPVYSLVGCYAFGDEKQPPTPDELERLVHTIIAGGPRGLIYRLRRDRLTPELTARIRRLNAELAHLSPHLAVADVWPWPSAPQRPDLVARALLAGDQALVLLLIRRPVPEGETPPEGGTLTLTLDLPDTLVPRGAALITPDGPRPLAATVARNGKAPTLDVPLPDVATACIVHLARAAR